MSYFPYRPHVAYPDAPFWNLEGLPEASANVPPLRPGVLTIDVDLSQHVEWMTLGGQVTGIPRRWCVTREQVIAAMDEFIDRGRIDYDSAGWCQMEFGTPPRSDG